MAKNKNEKKKRRRIPIPVKCLIALLVLLLITGIIFTVYMKQQTNPDYVAQRYIAAFMAKDPSALFQFLGIEKSTFISEESFASYLEECLKYSEIRSYGLTRQTDPSVPGQINYHISYQYGPHSKPYTQTLILKKSDEKLYLFFDIWEIDCSEFFAKNASIQIPAGASASIDGIALTQEQKKEETDQLATYGMGDLFTGTHKITVSMEGFKDYSANVSLQNTDYKDQPLYTITDSMLSITKETEKELASQAEKMIEALYTGALQNDSFEKLHKKYSFEDSVRSSLEQKYNTLVNNHILSAAHLSGVDFNEFSSSCTTAYAEDRCYAVKITTSVGYTAFSVTADGSYEKSTPGNSVFITTMHYQNGKWVIHDTTALDHCVYYLS